MRILYPASEMASYVLLFLKFFALFTIILAHSFAEVLNEINCVDFSIPISLVISVEKNTSYKMLEPRYQQLAIPHTETEVKNN